MLSHLEDGKLVLKKSIASGTEMTEKNGRWDVERLFAEILNGMKQRQTGEIPQHGD